MAPIKEFKELKKLKDAFKKEDYVAERYFP